MKFRDLEVAAEKVTGSGSLSKSSEPESLSYYNQEDLNLALLGLRIDVERRLRSFSREHGLPDTIPLSLLLKRRESSGMIAASAAEGIENIIAAGNKAAHGANVDRDVADWTIKGAPKILRDLDF